ncbi:MAG: YgaP family membrane protein [Desulfohalobiaceae bacterium]
MGASCWWLLLTALVGVNLLQSAFTDICPMMWLLKVLGFKAWQHCIKIPIDKAFFYVPIQLAGQAYASW